MRTSEKLARISREMVRISREMAEIVSQLGDEKVGVMTDLVTAVEEIEDSYKEFCYSLDHDFGEAEGHTYEHGINLEFQIEARDWHNISKALRNLKRI